MRWEIFLDGSYYDMWAVRPIGDADFNSKHLHHFKNKEDAENFKESVENPFELNDNIIAYKLVRKMKDGSLAPLFINKKFRLPFNEWLTAESHPTKGFAYRKGWHCTLQPYAPHLSKKSRVWILVSIKDFEYYQRPESQGGTWVLAQKMKVLQELT